MSTPRMRMHSFTSRPRDKSIRQLYLSVSAVLLFICYKPQVIHSNLVVTPLNTAVVLGNPTTLYCSTDNDAIVNWQFFNSPGGIQALYNGKTNPRWVYHIFINISSALVSGDTITSYNINFNSTSMSDVGTYVCQDIDGTGNSSGMRMTILASDPVCLSSVLDNAIFPNTKITLSCSVTCNGTYTPTLMWVNCTDAVSAVTGSSNDTQVATSITVLATRTIVECTMYAFFNTTPKTSSNDQSFPAYTYTWSYGKCVNSKEAIVNNLQFNLPTGGAKVPVGSSVTATALGCLPTFVWTNRLTGSQTQGPVFIFNTVELYNLSCTASNQVFGQNQSVTSDIVVDVHGLLARSSYSSLHAGCGSLVVWCCFLLLLRQRYTQLSC